MEENQVMIASQSGFTDTDYTVERKYTEERDKDTHCNSLRVKE